MNNKITVKETIVVEGKSDLAKLKNIFNANIIITNGSTCDDKTLNIIKKCNETNGVILFLDPDYVGEKIRKKISQYIPNVKHAFIDKKYIDPTRPKNGIAEMENEILIEALNNVVTFESNNNSLSLNEYDSLNLNNKKSRLLLCSNLKISYCNNKQLFKRLNMLKMTKSQISEILNNENNKK